MPLRGYLVVPDAKGLTGIMLRAPEGGARKNRSVLCELCRDVFSKEDVLLWVAKRAGQAGREGNTGGPLICADFLCYGNLRKEPPANEINPDPAAVVLQQIQAAGPDCPVHGTGAGQIAAKRNPPRRGRVPLVGGQR